MGTGISWTDETWNILVGCTPVSKGCQFCYAAGTSLAPRLARHPNLRVRRKYEGVAKIAGDGRAVFTGRVNADWTRAGVPLRWSEPRRVFVNSMSDLYHHGVDGFGIAAHFAIMAAAERHLFQVLTKRPDRQRAWMLDAVARARISDAADRMADNPEAFGITSGAHVDRLRRIGYGQFPWPLPNVVLGTSVEDQDAADLRIPTLMATPAALRFLSIEPLIGPVLLPARWGGSIHHLAIGGESNALQPERARPMAIEWVRSLASQARAVSVPFHVKQMGAAFARARGIYGRDPAGKDTDEWPEDLRVQQDLPLPAAMQPTLNL